MVLQSAGCHQRRPIIQMAEKMKELRVIHFEEFVRLFFFPPSTGKILLERKVCTVVYFQYSSYIRIIGSGFQTVARKI